jgi:ADP-ribosylglycohydrolase
MGTPTLATATTTRPADYLERVYAGVLGKIIGVYLGRPFEGWWRDKIAADLGEIEYYVNDRTDVALKNYRLVVPDDDITGTLTFARTLADFPVAAIDAVRVGHTWLNYIIENRTVLWWGGRGLSTEHTAYLHLRDGVRPPATGSTDRNGPVVAEQVGAQIFVEGWAMACPGDPERAVHLAAQAASVSHDGEALHAAKVVAALVAASFTESDMDRLLDTAITFIPADSLIRRVVDDVREWHAGGEDWRRGYERINERYGYGRYPGNCHVVPNHALVIHALAHSGGEFGTALGIVNSCGWDTDSNAGNVGCITGVRGGLAGIDAGPDWRGPVADRLYLPTADGGGAITDAAREALTITGYAAALRGEPAPTPPKGGSRFHFALPGSVQGFAPVAGAPLRVENVTRGDGARALALHYRGPGAAVTPTFLTPDTLVVPPYGQAASPTLYSGQEVRARVHAGDEDVEAALLVHVFDGADELRPLTSPPVVLTAGASGDLTWLVPDTGGQPVGDVGITLTPRGNGTGTAYLDRLDWSGEPDVTLTQPVDGGTMWRHAWVNTVDSYDRRGPEAFRLVHNRGDGMLIQGTRDWRDYEVRADVQPRLARSVGVAARVRGLRRYYALRLVERRAVQLVRVLDDEITVLAEQPFAWDYYRTYDLRLQVVGDALTASIDDLRLAASDSALTSGAVALFVEDGYTATNAVRITAANPRSAAPLPAEEG